MLNLVVRKETVRL